MTPSEEHFKALLKVLAMAENLSGALAEGLQVLVSPLNTHQVRQLRRLPQPLTPVTHSYGKVTEIQGSNAE